MKVSHFALTAMWLMAAGAVHAADAPQPEAKAFHVGKLDLVALHDTQFVLPNDGKVFGGDAGPAAVTQVLTAAGAPTDTITLSVDALLVKTGGHVVLIDTGTGPKAHGALMASLAQAGISPDAITDVLITHSHGDHVGGLVTADGQPAFPKATVRLSAKEWTYLQGQADMADLVKAITPQVKTFEPGDTVAPGITAVDIKGHTPGHSGYEIASGKARLLDIGDLAHSSIVSLSKPDWAMGFDSDAAAGRDSRKAWFGKLSKSHEEIFAPHFPFPGVGKIAAKGDHFTWQPTLKAGGK